MTGMERWRRREACLRQVLARALRNPYFRLKPPRTAGREQFGREYAAEFLGCSASRHSDGRGCAGYGDGVDGGDDSGELQAVCAAR